MNRHAPAKATGGGPQVGRHGAAQPRGEPSQVDAKATGGGPQVGRHGAAQPRGEPSQVDAKATGGGPQVGRHGAAQPRGEPSQVVVWFTGLPSSGKSTLAVRARARLEREGKRCVLLDGDEVRAQVFPMLGHSESDRDAFYAALGQLAALLARQGQLVLVAATANRAAYRSAARALAPRFIEVFVDTPLEECERRDAKGLYRQARSGELKTEVPGVSTGYERPEAPEVRATGGEDGAALERLCALLA